MPIEDVVLTGNERVDVAFMHEGVGGMGSCPKKAGSNNCVSAICMRTCPCIKGPNEKNMTKVVCDSLRVSDEIATRDAILKRVAKIVTLADRGALQRSVAEHDVVCPQPPRRVQASA